MTDAGPCLLDSPLNSGKPALFTQDMPSDLDMPCLKFLLAFAPDVDQLGSGCWVSRALPSCNPVDGFALPPAYTGLDTQSITSGLPAGSYPFNPNPIPATSQCCCKRQECLTTP